MVVCDPKNLCCEIYEVKHKYVIYRGESTTYGDVQYLNVEDYLKSLS